MNRSPQSRPRSASRPGGSAASSSGAGSRSGTPRSRAAASRSEQQARAQADEALQRNLAVLRETLEHGVVITSERIQEAMDDAVNRGRMTRDDAEDMVTRLINAGRQQTKDLLDEIETLLTRGRETIGGTARSATTRARNASATDRVLREVDRARRAAGLGADFPITDYDNLTAAQVTGRLEDLAPAELRRVRDHEKRNANRKSVLNAVEKKLA
ncbi:MAG TPA: hypothetical protein VGV36_05370 [Solirubrobacteraceae bacterium]|nr:hypothetical protein [Solirubrobacteraceae bacterium]